MAVSFTDVSYQYDNGHFGLKDITIHLESEKKTAILGLNGSGKSTLLNLINGIFTPTEGEVEIFGVKVIKENLAKIRKNVGFLFDYPDYQLFSTSVYQDIKFGLDNYDYPEEEKDGIIHDALIRLDIENLKNSAPQDLSLGQKKKVCLAGVMVLDPQIIVCDEPFSGLDGKFVPYFMSLLDEWVAMGKTIIFSSHDVNICYEWSDDTLVLSNGKLIAQGHTEELMTSSELYDTTGLERPILFSLFEGKSVKPRNVEEGRKYVEKLQL